MMRPPRERVPRWLERMCIAAFVFGSDSRYRLAFAANRDEVHSRATVQAAWWEDSPDVLGGRDRVAGGSWLAVNRRGWLAAVTNLPQSEPRTFPHSRGELVSGFLTGDGSAAEFATDFCDRSADFGPCNLLVWDGTELYYAATGLERRRLVPGTHALGNAPLGSDWPRVQKAEAGFTAALASADPEAALLTMLSDREAVVPDSADAALARRRTEIFINDARYGTRSSTVVLMTHEGAVTFVERGFGADGHTLGDARYTFETSA
jgi:uncharacterized protein with NRDE domain